ncbi:hypothetical protein Dimus_004948 [Dionaea muscipula]
MSMEPLYQFESRQAANDTDVASKDTDVAAALLLIDLAAATSIGTITATSVGNMELLAAMSVAAKDTDVSATLVPAATCRPLRMIVPEMGRIRRYIGTLANTDAKFFNDFAREDFQLEKIIYIENLWKNWDSIRTRSDRPSKIQEELTNYVWGLDPEWGIERVECAPCEFNSRCVSSSKDICIWFPITRNDYYVWMYQVLAVCLMARSHWVLAHINLEEWTIEIYDSLAHKTPKNPGHRLASFEGMRTLLPLILDEAGYFKRSGRRGRIDPFQTRRIPPENVPKQEDDDSCGIWTLYFAEQIILGMAIKVDLQQKYITGMRKHYALQIFANSDPIED